MGMKIYLSPSKQTANLYAAGNTNEQEQCNRIAEATHKALEKCGFEVKRAPAGQAIETSVKQSNAWGADLHIPIHTNAGGGRGCVVFVSSKTDERLAFAQPVYDEIAKITTANETYGVRTANFYEIKYTTAKCIYIECEFHDNAVDAQWIIDHVEDIGEAIAKGICKGAGVKYMENEATKSEFELASEWAIERGIVKGYGDGTYGWADNMTRGQMVRMLYRFYKIIKG